MTYKFSVVMPIYNLESYLEESIGSVLCQSIGFEENIQLILVNDGSTDRTDEICRDYRNRYPRNVVYVSQENKGVSAARNAGMPFIQGTYVNFFDGDDIWQEDGFARVWQFLQQYGTEIDVVTCVQKLFEAKQGYRETYYKFRDGDRLIDISREPAAVELSIVSAFFKAEAIREKRFDERLDYGESAKFLCQVLVEKGKYGVMQSVEYLVRRRADHSSASQNHKLTWQTTTLTYCQKYLCDLAYRVDPAYRPYLQHVVLKTLKYRITREPMVQGAEAEEYIKDIQTMLKAMEDEVIISAPYMSWPLKLFALKQKHGDTLTDKLRIKKGRLYFETGFLVNLAKKSLVIQEMEIEQELCRLRGRIRGVPDLPFFLTAQDNKVSCPVTVTEREGGSLNSFWGENIYQEKRFEAMVSLKREVCRVSFYLSIKDQTIELEPFYDGEAKAVKNGFLRLADRMILVSDSGKLVIKPYSFFRKLKYQWERR